MDRRQFLHTAFAASVAGGFGTIRPARLLAAEETARPPGIYGSAHRASVADFGADPTGATDATGAVRKAIATLAQRNARLVFPPGRYSFSAPDGTAMLFKGYEGLEVFGNGAELSFAGGLQPLLMQACSNVEIHDLKVDWARPPFSQGTVVQVAGPSITVEVDPEFLLDGTERVTSIAEYDGKTGLPASGSIDLSGALIEATANGRQRLSLRLSRAVAMREGTRLLLLHGRGAPACFQLTGCDTALVESVTVHASPGAGVLAEGCRDLAFEDFSTVTRAGSGRWISANSSGVRLVDCQGTLGMKRCHFERTGGAGVEMYQSYWRLDARLDERTASIQGCGGKPLEPWQLPAAGSILQLSDPARLNLLGEIALQKAEITPAGTRFTFKESLSSALGAGTLLCNAMGQPRAVLDDCTFSGNGAEGLLAHGRVRVTNSHFTECAGPAIAMGADQTAMQGPTVQSVSITENTFSKCNYGGDGERGGTVTVNAVRRAAGRSTAAEDADAPRVNQGIMIQRNRFSGDSGPAIACADASWLTVEGNLFGRMDLLAGTGKLPRAIVLRNVDQSFLEQNQSKTNGNILLIGCTDKVQASENLLLTEMRTV